MNKDVLFSIKEVMEEEIKAIKNVCKNLDENYEKAVDLIHNCKGKVVFTGVGKSGHIGEKLAATFASTGTPAFFVHSTEALHGDLGMIEEKDIVIAISNSGETKEVLSIISSIKYIGSKIISITGNNNSSLAKESDVALEAKVDHEADPLNLAPTSSSTVALVLGDALAITLSQLKEFKRENFAVFHPGGSLGKRLFNEMKKL
ncbi:KpsF/GutQ family sugar-phosphate isomerase [Clostridium tetani]|uniref:KpsF/GutQ family sugar-phosphate isomerase n=1 Tax=Clostridium tetani TaxID=1513 RepID=UPI00100C17E3|nr:SIS domain-containing protein [Clostridium tetani]RXM72534.1 KpsF/GutQ family sugar-phosphate isomerase [Clostridium tetani]